MVARKAVCSAVEKAVQMVCDWVGLSVVSWDVLTAGMSVA